VYRPLSPADLDQVLEFAKESLSQLRGQRLFITGGTGFIGSWLLETLAWANRRLELGTQVTVLTRDPDAFRRKAPYLAADPAVTLVPGDVRSYSYPEGTYAHVIHAAAEASARLNAEQPLEMFDTIVSGTRHTLDFARHCRASNLLLLSSGAVYGPQPPELERISEGYKGGPDTMNPLSAYAQAKRSAELLCSIYAARHTFAVKVARIFALLGPRLPLDAHFAAGNFIRDALRRGTVRVLSDGTPVRSYLYAGDLAVWLWTILVHGESCQPYNVGSEEPVTVAQLAQTVARLAGPGVEVEVVAERRDDTPSLWERTPVRDSDRYVPCTNLARSKLGLVQTVTLADAIVRTLSYYRQP